MINLQTYYMKKKKKKKLTFSKMEYDCDCDCDCDYDCVYCFVSKILQAHGSPTMAHPL